MRYIERLAIPEVLERLGKRWTERFVASGTDRPPSAQYGHKRIRDVLNAMSNYKCFYCERLLKDDTDEVDHYIEVSQFKHLAFLWQNLYLSCENCNNKLSNIKMPVLQTLDPCTDSDPEIEISLTFTNELIRPFDNSQKGLRTIQKYRLSSSTLDLLRSQELHKFKDVLLAIRDKQIAEGGRAMNPDEIEKLRSFSNVTHPFSLMFKRILSAHGLL